jgi:hypothetical protein
MAHLLLIEHKNFIAPLAANTELTMHELMITILWRLTCNYTLQFTKTKRFVHFKSPFKNLTNLWPEALIPVSGHQQRTGTELGNAL